MGLKSTEAGSDLIAYQISRPSTCDNLGLMKVFKPLTVSKSCSKQSIRPVVVVWTIGIKSTTPFEVRIKPAVPRCGSILILTALQLYNRNHFYDQSQEAIREPIGTSCACSTYKPVPTAGKVLENQSYIHIPYSSRITYSPAYAHS